MRRALNEYFAKCDGYWLVSGRPFFYRGPGQAWKMFTALETFFFPCQNCAGTDTPLVFFSLPERDIKSADIVSLCNREEENAMNNQAAHTTSDAVVAPAWNCL